MMREKWRGMYIYTTLHSVYSMPFKVASYASFLYLHVCTNDISCMCFLPSSSTEHETWAAWEARVGEDEGGMEDEGVMVETGKGKRGRSGICFSCIE